MTFVSEIITDIWEQELNLVALKELSVHLDLRIHIFNFAVGLSLKNVDTYL